MRWALCVSYCLPTGLSRVVVYVSFVRLLWLNQRVAPSSNIFSMNEHFQAFLHKCISVDLEVDPGTATIFAIAAVREDARSPILAKKRDISAALDRLETEAADAEHLIGHN